MSGIVGQNLGRGSGLVKATAVVADSVSGASIVDDAIDSEHYAAGSIDEAHIGDNQVTLAKMAGGTDGNIISFDASGDPVAIATGDDGEVLTSTGAGSPPAFEAAAGGGKIGQVVTASKTDTFTLADDVTATDITGLTVDITPVATSSKVLIHFSVMTSTGDTGHTGPAIFLIRESTHISLGDASASRVQSTTAPIHEQTDGNAYGQHYCVFLDSPSTTSEITYKLQIYSATGGDTTSYVNRGRLDTNAAYGLRAASNLVAMEVLA